MARKADLVRSEAREAARRKRPERRAARLKRWRAELHELRIWIKGVGLKLRRRTRLGWAAARRRGGPAAAAVRKRLGPVLSPLAGAARALWRGVSAVLRPVAPLAAAGLFAVVRAIGALLSAILAVASRVRALVVGVASAVKRWVDAHVTAARAAAALALAAAVAVAASQFIDYRGIAIGADQYQGDAGEVAPVPQLNREPAGDAHAYLMLPLALAAAVLTWLALRGRRRLALGVSLIGLAGIVVSLAVDLPQALDTGRIGEAYEGTEARLLTGFWMQLIGSAVLVGAGLALARFAGGAGARTERSGSPTQTAARGAHSGRGAAGSGASA
jgi:hypothetical protein